MRRGATTRKGKEKVGGRKQGREERREGGKEGRWYVTVKQSSRRERDSSIIFVSLYKLWGERE
jgi:hypothetical protein